MSIKDLGIEEFSIKLNSYNEKENWGLFDYPKRSRARRLHENNPPYFSYRPFRIEPRLGPETLAPRRCKSLQARINRLVRTRLQSKGSLRGRSPTRIPDAAGHRFRIRRSLPAEKI